MCIVAELDAIHYTMVSLIKSVCYMMVTENPGLLYTQMQLLELSLAKMATA